MDGRGGCCIARYGGGSAYDVSKVDRIMLRFRPIAPKPVAGRSVNGVFSPEKSTRPYLKGGRGRKRCIRDSCNKNISSSSDNKRCNSKKRKPSPEEKRDGFAGETVVTLPLLPETPEPKDSPARVSPEARDPPMWLSFDRSVCGLTMETPEKTELLRSCVTVECLTDTWIGGNGLWCTDEERKINLEKDTCPGFISDEFGRVKWTNSAYRKKVGQGEDVGEIMVWVVMKERIPVELTAFSCRVRLEYTCGKEKSSLTLPCDVWSMNYGGGFAWRLDVEAALCLGR